MNQQTNTTILLDITLSKESPESASVKLLGGAMSEILPQVERGFCVTQDIQLSPKF